MDAACLPVLARVALLARLEGWRELTEAERDGVRGEVAVLTAIADPRS